MVSYQGDLFLRRWWVLYQGQFLRDKSSRTQFIERKFKGGNFLEGNFLCGNLRRVNLLQGNSQQGNWTRAEFSESYFLGGREGIFQEVQFSFSPFCFWQNSIQHTSIKLCFNFGQSIKVKSNMYKPKKWGRESLLIFIFKMEPSPKQ